MISEYNNDTHCIEGGADLTEMVQIQAAPDNRTLISEMKQLTGTIKDIANTGLRHYWAVQSTASKITHGIVGVVSSILSLNLVFATIAHFTWDRSQLGQNLKENEILVLYCQTQGCGCENGVLNKLRKQIVQHMEGDENSENVKVYTQLYPGAPLIQFWSKFFQLIQLICLITIFFGPMICRKIYGYGAGVEDKSAIRYPYFVQKLAVGGCLKKLGMFLLCFVGFNIIVALMTISGAFEMYHGGDLVFSSLESNRMVTGQDVIDCFPRLDGKESPLVAALGDKLNAPVGHMH